MKIGINCGHTASGAGYGAVGIIEESLHTRLVGNCLMEKMRNAGIKVIDCTVDRAASRKEYLAETAAKANREELDWFVSIHFNASADHQGRGVEVYTYQGRQHPEALAVCTSMRELGFGDRGIKDGTGLYVIRQTKAKAMLIEVCFCDNQADVDLYYAAGAHDAVARAVLSAFIPAAKEGLWQHKNHAAEFIQFVGRVAGEDWRERKIILPSVVTAQAIKESAWGTSELARQANALFGIKENGWTGRIYVKTAVEQRKDGSYYAVPQTKWRAYDSPEQSILDHNDYIATRSTDGGRTLRYQPVIGCDNYILACQYLQKCGYATAAGYADSLIHDYIEKYNLTQFDFWEENLKQKI